MILNLTMKAIQLNQVSTLTHSFNRWAMTISI
jgi:hypothetical protein